MEGSTHTALGYIDSRSNVLTLSAWSYLRSTQHYPSNELDVVEVYSTRPDWGDVNTHGVTVAKFHPITNPTPKGSRSPRNFLQAKFLTALAEDFERDGAAAIKICRIEEPAQYVKIVASLMPKEFAVTDNALGDLSDDELGQLLTRAQAMLKIVDVMPIRESVDALPAPKEVKGKK